VTRRTDRETRPRDSEEVARRTGRFPQLPHLCNLNGAESGGPLRVDFRGTGRRRTVKGRNHKDVEGSGVPTENTVRVCAD
jgi:hypothetical protein